MSETLIERDVYLSQYPVPDPLPKVLDSHTALDTWADCCGGGDGFGKPIQGHLVRQAVRWHWKRLALEALPERAPVIDIEGMWKEIQQEIQIPRRLPRVNRPELFNNRWLGSAFDRSLGDTMLRRDEWSLTLAVKTGGGTTAPDSETCVEWLNFGMRRGLGNAHWEGILGNGGWSQFTGEIGTDAVLIGLLGLMGKWETQRWVIEGEIVEVYRQSTGWTVGWRDLEPALPAPVRVEGEAYQVVSAINERAVSVRAAHP